MCGIAGWVGAPARRLEAVTARRVLESLGHRGPDDCGWLVVQGRRTRGGRVLPDQVNGDAVLLHRRLSILDLTESGSQPMSSRTGLEVLTFNGEIYNYVELREELRAQGHEFRSTSDTEVLLAALNHWGLGALPRLVGMYAFGFIDVGKGRVVLARDPFGIKPLYVHRTEGGFVFASEVKSLLEATSFVPRANAERIYTYLRFGASDHGRDTMLEGVEQVPGGESWTFDLFNPTAPEVHRHWGTTRPTRVKIPFEDAVAGVRDAFLESIRLHLRSDVPVGCALSGGIDSSAIVGAMRRVGGPATEIQSFSYRASADGLDEGRWAELAARETGAQNATVRISDTDLWRDLESVIEAQGEPFTSTSVYAQYCVFKLAHAHKTKVMLDGQGADELFAGYAPFVSARIAALISGARVWQALTLLRHAGSLRAGRLGIIKAGAASLIPPEWQRPFREMLGKGARQRGLSTDWYRTSGADAALATTFRSHGNDAFSGALWRSLTESVLPSLLRYEDRNSMSFSIESRVPFLTTQLAELALSLPEEFLVNDQADTKAVFRAAMAGIVPPEILARRDKIGFETPEGSWIRSSPDRVRRILSSDAAHAAAPIDLIEANSYLDDVISGKVEPDRRVWRWVNLIEWSRLYGVRFR